MSNKGYEMKIMDHILEFTTPNYKAEKTSVLHSGVYTREFSSMLFASAICLTGFVILNRVETISLLLKTLFLIILFIASFLGSRFFLFHEKKLIARFDKDRGILTLKIPRLIGHHHEEILFDNIEDIVIDTKRFEPTNIDGIRFVERISAQHGSAVPGLDQVEEFITLKLRLRDGSERIIYSAKIDIEPELPLKEIKDFLR